MSYQVYTTEALVCGNFQYNTADKTFLLFTREMGMLFAAARSVREERSRQRYALQDFSLIKVSLIKGKSDWKIGSVETEKNFYTEAHTRPARGSVVNLFKTLRRFIQGEEATPELFDFCLEATGYLIQKIEGRERVDLLIQLKILSDLGYVEKNYRVESKKIKNILKNNQLKSEKLSELIKNAVLNSQL